MMAELDNNQEFGKKFTPFQEEIIQRFGMEIGEDFYTNLEMQLASFNASGEDFLRNRYPGQGGQLFSHKLRGQIQFYDGMYALLNIALPHGLNALPIETIPKGGVYSKISTKTFEVCFLRVQSKNWSRGNYKLELSKLNEMFSPKQGTFDFNSKTPYESQIIASEKTLENKLFLVACVFHLPATKQMPNGDIRLYFTVPKQDMKTMFLTFGFQDVIDILNLTHEDQVEEAKPSLRKRLDSLDNDDLAKDGS